MDRTGVGGGGGGGGGVEGIFDVEDTFDEAGDAGADFGGDSAGVDFNADNIGADLHADSVVGTEFDVGADTGGSSTFSRTSLSDITSSGIKSRGGECTSTMLCCVLSLLCDSEVLSKEETLDLLLLLMAPL